MSKQVLTGLEPEHKNFAYEGSGTNCTDLFSFAYKYYKTLVLLSSVGHGVLESTTQSAQKVEY